MKRYSRSEIVAEIRNGNEEVLVYLTKKYFPVVRRLLRIRGFRDAFAPDFFSDVLATVFQNLKRQAIGPVDFEPYFMNAVNEEIQRQIDYPADAIAKDQAGSPGRVIARCVSVLDEEAQKLLSARIAEKLSYESIAEKFGFSNSVIAQYEVNKALNQLEGIVKLRLNILEH